MSNVPSCDLAPADTVEWWEKFVTGSEVGRRNGLISNDGTKVMVFGWDSEDARGRSGEVDGTVDLREASDSLVGVIGPSVVTGRALNQNLVDTQTREIRTKDCYIRRRGAANTLPVKLVRVEAKSVVDGTQLYYNGFWFCIPKDDLRNGDTIEFGGIGSDSYTTWARWNVIK